MATKRHREAELSFVADQEARDMSRKRKFALVWAVFMIVQGLVVDVPRYDRPHPVFLCACVRVLQLLPSKPRIKIEDGIRALVSLVAGSYRSGWRRVLWWRVRAHPWWCLVGCNSALVPFTPASVHLESTIYSLTDFYSGSLPWQAADRPT